MRTSRIAIHYVLLFCVLAAQGWADCRKTLSPGMKQLPDPTLISFSFAPDNVVGGGLSLATVTLSRSVVGCNWVIKLSSDRPTAAAVPETVTVRPGQSMETFAIET